MRPSSNVAAGRYRRYNAATCVAIGTTVSTRPRAEAPVARVAPAGYDRLCRRAARGMARRLRQVSGDDHAAPQRAEPARERAVPLDDGDRVARVVVDVRRGRGAAGGG